MELIMLGTGSAMVTECYNTCFILQNTEGSFMVDAGGGNTILNQLNKAKIEISEIKGLFVTHAHSDHIIGSIWLVRLIAQQMLKNKFNGTFNIYGHDKVIEVIRYCCNMMLPAKFSKLLDDRIILNTLVSGEQFTEVGILFTCFDIYSTKEKQFAFSAILNNGKKLVSLGDEPYNELNKEYVEKADWLLSEAFCTSSDADIFRPYEKHHSTALDAGHVAAKLGVKNLVLYHTEDTKIEQRKYLYSNEAAMEFSGKIFVPNDLEVLNLD